MVTHVTLWYPTKGKFTICSHDVPSGNGRYPASYVNDCRRVTSKTMNRGQRRQHIVIECYIVYFGTVTEILGPSPLTIIMNI